MLLILVTVWMSTGFDFCCDWFLRVLYIGWYLLDSVCCVVKQRHADGQKGNSNIGGAFFIHSRKQEVVNKRIGHSIPTTLE